MRRCIVLTGGPLSDFDHVRPEICPDDYIIACDSGYAAARHFGITPHLAVGDFDSLQETVPEEIPVLRASTHKDDTDTMLGLRCGLEQGCRDFLILGGFGGRLDHTISNLQALSFLCENEAAGRILANRNAAWIVRNGSLRIPRMEGYHLSVYAWGGVCEGVTLKGLEYPLTDYTMRPVIPVGTSNEFSAEEAVITAGNGTLLVIASRE